MEEEGGREASHLLFQVVQEVTEPLEGSGVWGNPEEVDSLQFERCPVVLQSVPVGVGEVVQMDGCSSSCTSF